MREEKGLIVGGRTLGGIIDEGGACCDRELGWRKENGREEMEVVLLSHFFFPVALLRNAASMHTLP